MNGNPFFVPAAGENVGAGLAGIGAILSQKRAQRQEREALEAQARQSREAQAALYDAWKSKDPARMYEVAIAYPELSQMATQGMGLVEDFQKQEATEFASQVLSNPENAVAAAERRATLLEAQGRDASHTRDFIEQYQVDPEGALSELRAGFILANPEAYDAFAKANAGPESTTAFRTLQERAAASGLEPGTAAYQEFMRYGGPAPTSGGLADQRERKIDQYQRLFNMSLEDATRAVDSQTMLDDRGNLITYDPVTGQGTLVDVNVGEEQPIRMPPTGTSIEDLAFDPAQGTGFGASFIGLWNSTLGQIPLFPIGDTTAEAAQNLRILERDAIRALGSSGRPPVIEQERIASLLPQAMDPLQNPQEAQYKMTNFVDLMMNQYTDDLRYSQDRRNPKEVRETSAERARNIESIVRRVLKPEAAQAMFDSLNKMETEIGELNTMSMEEILELDPSTLSDAQLDIYIQRINE